MTQPAPDDRLWSAISDPTRVRVIEVLLDGAANVSEVARRLPVSRQAVAKHLAVLAGVGLVEAARDGRELRYHLAPERLADARLALTERAEAWDARLARLKALAEAAVDP
jgi:ArsR family transcriptional regulator, cadmium/lead-responsive transcriptional repressor